MGNEVAPTVLWAMGKKNLLLHKPHTSKGA